MNPVTTALTLNLQLPNIAAVAWAVQGDIQSRQIRATLVDGSSSWTPQAGYHGVIRYFKPDGTTGVYDVDEGGATAVTWSGNIATIKIAQQALSVAGTVIMQLEFYDSNDARVSTFGWAMNVQPSAVTDTEFLSTDYYSILTLQIAGVLGATGHPPYINSTSKNWMVWDENSNAYVDSGYSSIGTTGPAPTLTATSYQYANSNSGTTVPTSWSNTRPATAPGTWAWTKTTLTFGASGSTTVYTCAYQGNDGTGAPGTSTPLMDGTAAVGTATAFAREDHKHPSDTSRASASDLATLQTNVGKISQHKATKTIPASSWNGSGPYTQTFTISGYTVTSNTKVDIQADDLAYSQLISDNVQAIYVENNSGTLSFVAIGAPTTQDITVQLTYYETV